MDSKYRFDNYDWMANARGFDRPSDVYFGSVLLGVIMSDITGDFFRIERVMTPTGAKNVEKTDRNKFKTQEEAAKMLHLIWKHQRNQS